MKSHQLSFELFYCHWSLVISTAWSLKFGHWSFPLCGCSRPIHKHLSRFRTPHRTDESFLLHDVEELCRTRIAHAEPALEQGSRSLSRLLYHGNRVEEHAVAAVVVGFQVDLRIGARDAFLVADAATRFVGVRVLVVLVNESDLLGDFSSSGDLYGIDDALRLLRGNEDALDAHRLLGRRRHIEHVSFAKEVVRADRV